MITSFTLVCSTHCKMTVLLEGSSSSIIKNRITRGRFFLPGNLNIINMKGSEVEVKALCLHEFTDDTEHTDFLFIQWHQ